MYRLTRDTRIAAYVVPIRGRKPRLMHLTCTTSSHTTVSRSNPQPKATAYALSLARSRAASESLFQSATESHGLCTSDLMGVQSKWTIYFQSAAESHGLYTTPPSKHSDTKAAPSNPPLKATAYALRFPRRHPYYSQLRFNPRPRATAYALSVVPLLRSYGVDVPIRSRKPRLMHLSL